MAATNSPGGGLIAAVEVAVAPAIDAVVVAIVVVEAGRAHCRPWREGSRARASELVVRCISLLSA